MMLVSVVPLLDRSVKVRRVDQAHVSRDFAYRHPSIHRPVLEWSTGRLHGQSQIALSIFSHSVERISPERVGVTREQFNGLLTQSAFIAAFYSLSFSIQLGATRTKSTIVHRNASYQHHLGYAATQPRPKRYSTIMRTVRCTVWWKICVKSKCDTVTFLLSILAFCF